MRFISVDAHNILDYIWGVFAIAIPWLFGFAGGNMETYIFIAAGGAVILKSLLTNYKYSLSKIIAFNSHLTLEIIIGIILAASPWIFGFNSRTYIPHLLFGIVIVVVSLMSKKFINYRAYS